MKLLITAISILTLSGCVTSSIHVDIIEASGECQKGVHSIVHAELSKGNTTTLLCK